MIFASKIFFAVTLATSLLSGEATSKRSVSRRHHSQLASREVKSVEARGENGKHLEQLDARDDQEMIERDLVVEEIDPRSLGFTDDEIVEWFGHEYTKSKDKRATYTKASVSTTAHKGLGSWYEADSQRDSTNGVGWCGIPYNNNSPGFAPPFKMMSKNLATWSSDPSGWKQATKKYCGLEAEVTYKGRTEKLYILDAFDPAWVKTTYAIDILIKAFEKLWGKNTSNKNDVMNTVTWKLTGRRATKYAVS